MAKLQNKKNKINLRKDNDFKICTECNPLTHLKFNFSFISYNKKMNSNDYVEMFERIKLLSSEPYPSLVIKYRGQKSQFMEIVSANEIGIKKEIPREFKKIFSTETNEKLAIFRIYPNNEPKVARIIGMLKGTIFYIFYIDGDGSLYQH